MPYIKKRDRKQLDQALDHLMSTREHGAYRPMSPGELNYLITRLLMVNIQDLSYTKANEAIGVLECAKLEMYRRALAPYEDVKKTENGDVDEYK